MTVNDINTLCFLGFIILLLLAFTVAVIWGIIDEIKKHKEKEVRYKEYEKEMAELSEIAKKYQNVTDNDEWWEPCPQCKLFDGYDICCAKDNFGSVTDITKAYCEKHKLFTKKD